MRPDELERQLQANLDSDMRLRVSERAVNERVERIGVSSGATRSAELLIDSRKTRLRRRCVGVA